MDGIVLFYFLFFKYLKNMNLQSNCNMALFHDRTHDVQDMELLITLRLQGFVMLVLENVTC